VYFDFIEPLPFLEELDVLGASSIYREALWLRGFRIACARANIQSWYACMCDTMSGNIGN